MEELSVYFKPKRGGGELTRAFYDLSLKDKIKVVEQMEEADLLNGEAIKYKLANAILMHWPTNRGDEYPVTGVNRLSKAARLADEKNGI